MSTRPEPDPFSAACPSRRLLEIIGGKWNLLIVAALGEQSIRTGDLQRRIEGISPKMLTQSLRTLEAHGLVMRRDYGEVPPRVDYRLTDNGRSLHAAVGTLDRWVMENFWTVADFCQSRGQAVGTPPASPGDDASDAQ